MDLFIFITFMLIVAAIGWGADRQWRKEHGIEQWRDRHGIHPMSEEEMRINATLAARRAEKRK
jgi:hypothetical protein